MLILELIDQWYKIESQSDAIKPSLEDINP